MRLALFDLDHTLLSADSDVLWCEFLLAQQMLPESIAAQYKEVARQYDEGTVTPDAYCGFHARIVAGLTPAELLPLRQRFLAESVRPRIPDDARELLQSRRALGDTLVLTTATSRVVSELTAAELGVDEYLCTELEVVDGKYTGRTQGVLNMRSGKVERIRDWLAASGLADHLLRDASFHTDSINDLALLSVVNRPVIVDPDPRLESTALRKGWTVLRLNRPFKMMQEPRAVAVEKPIVEATRIEERRREGGPSRRAADRDAHDQPHDDGPDSETTAPS